MREQAQRLDEAPALRARRLQIDAEDGSAAPRQQPLGELVVRVVRAAPDTRPRDHRMRGEEGHDLARILDVALHAHRQRLDALQDLPRRRGGHARAEVADALAARAQQERGRRRFLREHHVVEPVIGLGQRRELAARLRSVPLERPGVDQHAADDHPVARQELGRGVEDEIRAVVEGAHQPGRGERRIDQQRQAVVVRERRHARHVQHVEAGIAERLAEQQPRLVADRRAPCVEVARIDERRPDAEPRQRVVEQVVGSAVQRARRDDVPAGPHQRRDGEVQGRLPAGGRDGPHAAFERRDPLLEHGAGRIRDARVDVPRALHVEQRRRVIGVREDERRALVDRRRPRAGRGIGPRAGVKRKRVEAMRPGTGHGSRRSGGRPW